MSGWWVRRLDEVPQIAPEEPHDPVWYPLQHHFGLTGFGLNVYVARAEGDILLEEHDETGSDQEEVYLVTSGRARFTVDGNAHEVEAVSVVALTDPGVRRGAVALEAGTTLVAAGAPRGSFRSSWQPHHFEGVPLADSLPTIRSVIYCVIPPELADELYDKMVEYYKDNPNVTVIVDRRSGPDRRQGKAPPEGEQRKIRDRRRGRVPGEFPDIVEG